ncbi:cytochrome c oxidase assembly protein COX18, mitochondrial [Discoglossus pictus]
MFCRFAKSCPVLSSLTEIRSNHLLLVTRCPHAKACGTLNFKKYHQGWRQQDKPSSGFLSSRTYWSKSHRLAPWPPHCRTVVSVASLTAASTGRGYTGLGWYDSLADSAPVHLAENMLLTLQETSGLPWWANIVCATVALRTAVTLPLSVYQMYIIAKVENLQPEIESLAKRLRYEVSVYGKQHGWSDKVAKFHFRKNLKRIVSGLYVRDNCHPFKASLLIWIQIPMWICVSFALRNFSLVGTDEAVQRQLEDGGALWFPDLTVPDATWILPVSLGIINLVIVEIFALRKTELTRFQKIITNFIRGVSVLMIPIAASVPSSMALYWFSSSCVGLTHNLLLRSPALRRLCRIPRTKSDSDTPYKDIVSTFVAKYLQKK